MSNANTNAGVLDCVVEGDTPTAVCDEVVKRGLVSQLDLLDARRSELRNRRAALAELQVVLLAAVLQEVVDDRPGAVEGRRQVDVDADPPLLVAQLGQRLLSLRRGKAPRAASRG